MDSIQLNCSLMDHDNTKISYLFCTSFGGYLMVNDEMMIKKG
jgi:hypothetical protein